MIIIFLLKQRVVFITFSLTTLTGVKMETFKITKNNELNKWEDISSYFNELLESEINNSSDAKQYIKNLGILSAFVHEKMAWAYINMTCHTDNKEHVKLYQFFNSEIYPKFEEALFEVEKKLYNSNSFKELESDYNQYKLLIQTDIELYRENNLALTAEEGVISTQYDQISGGIMVEYNGEEYTLRQLGKLMETDIREERENIWKAMMSKKMEYKNDLISVFDRLFSLRSVIAKNTDFENYRDYMFKNKQRFDYTPEDCFEFHKSVEKEVVPIVKKIQLNHKKRLGVDSYRPWDLPGLIKGEKALTPFKTGQELLDKTIQVYEKIRPPLAKNLEQMKNNSMFDLDSRKGKAPGGYNYPLLLTDMPFIFMNSVGSQGDVTTLMHEGGHAMHSFQTKGLEIMEYKNTPSESAELASMSMELISMDYWGIFYENEQDLKRAKREQLERTINIFPWVMIVDAFQHWMYENPEHTSNERQAKYVELVQRFETGVIDYSGYEQYRELGWIYQLHITTVPFYYIEYAIAQLGALQIWRNYKINPDKAIDDYLHALSLGSSKSLPEVYKAANIEFNFSRNMIKDLMKFVDGQLEELL